MCRGVRIELFRAVEYLIEYSVLDKESKQVRVFISAFQMYVLHFGRFFRKPAKNSGLTSGQNDDPVTRT